VRTAIITALIAKPRTARAQPTPRRTGLQRRKIEPASQATVLVVLGSGVSTIGINSHRMTRDHDMRDHDTRDHDTRDAGIAVQ
jgi:hypothetical protein